MNNLKEFGKRLVTLNTGAQGLRGGLRCKVKEVPGAAPMMDFIASDETLDRYNEVIKVDGWQLDNFRANPVIPDCHDYSSIARILGRAQSISVADGKLLNRVEFCLDNPLGSLAYKMAKGGFIKSQSVGFIPLEWQNGAGKDQPQRTYTKCELLEVSLVVVPANPGATIGLALKSGAIQKRDLRQLADFLDERETSRLCREDSQSLTVPGVWVAGKVWLWSEQGSRIWVKAYPAECDVRKSDLHGMNSLGLEFDSVDACDQRPKGHAALSRSPSDKPPALPEVVDRRLPAPQR